MKVALVGNQNCGKTTLFNVLTGSNQKIGNWPGVTVEKKVGTIKNTNHELIDLPGIYSMYSYSDDERITREVVLSGSVELIINVIDVTSIERGLYLTTQLMELDVPVMVVLNMCDLLLKKGIVINEKELEKELGIKVVSVSALKEEGIDELKNSIEKDNDVICKKIFSKDIENRIDIISETFNVNKRFFSVEKIEEDDTEIIASERYDYIYRIKNKCIDISNMTESITDRLDKVFLNKWLAVPIFIVIMFLVYYLSVGVVGSFTKNLIDNGIVRIKNSGGSFLENIGVSTWIISLIIDGIITGIGSVIAFIPQLIILFFCISLLETSGYMSRIAFFLDTIFKKFGLSGKTIVPFIVGSRCSVSGIMTTRTIEDKEEREMAIMLTPFIPCSAKLPIIALFSGYFFNNKSGLISVSLYFLSILLILIISMILKKHMYARDYNTYISELPEYRVPSLKGVFKDVFSKVVSFIKRAGSVILVASIIIWFLLSFSFRLEYGVNIDESILASIGRLFSWVLYPVVGEFSWEITVSAIQGIIAKEQVVSSLAIIANVDGSSIFSENGIFNFFNSASAYAYVVFNLFTIPCFGTIGAMKKELGSNKKLLFIMMLQLFVALFLASLVYFIGLLIGG